MRGRGGLSNNLLSIRNSKFCGIQKSKQTLSSEQKDSWFANKVAESINFIDESVSCIFSARTVSKQDTPDPFLQLDPLNDTDFRVTLSPPPRGSDTPAPDEAVAENLQRTATLVTNRTRGSLAIKITAPEPQAVRSRTSLKGQRNSMSPNKVKPPRSGFQSALLGG